MYYIKSFQIKNTRLNVVQKHKRENLNKRVGIKYIKYVKAQNGTKTNIQIIFRCS